MEEEGFDVQPADMKLCWTCMEYIHYQGESSFLFFNTDKAQVK